MNPVRTAKRLKRRLDKRRAARAKAKAKASANAAKQARAAERDRRNAPPPVAPMPFRRWLDWRSEGVTRLIRVGRLRMVLVCPDPTGYGNVVMQTLLGLQLASELHARLYFVRRGTPIGAVLYELESSDVRIVGQRTTLGRLLKALWALAEGTLFARAFVRELGARAPRRERDPSTAAREGILAETNAQRARERLAKSRRAGYFGLDFRRLYATRPVSVRLPANLEDDARATGARLGLASDARIVCLHVRESGFHARDGREKSKQWLRNAHIATYLPALSLLVEQGYTVVRIGDPSMTPVHQEGVIDSATSPHRTEVFEFWSILNSQFFIASDSGPYAVTWMTRTPCLMVNLTNPLAQFPLMPRELTIVKHVVERDSGRYVPLRRMLTADFFVEIKGLLRSPTTSAYSFVDNTSEEIIEAVRDMQRFLADAPPETAAQAELRRIGTEESQAPQIIEGWLKKRGIPPPYLGSGRIAPTFAQQYIDAPKPVSVG